MSYIKIDVLVALLVNLSWRLSDVTLPLDQMLISPICLGIGPLSGTVRLKIRFIN